MSTVSLSLLSNQYGDPAPAFSQGQAEYLQKMAADIQTLQHDRFDLARRLSILETDVGEIKHKVDQISEQQTEMLSLLRTIAPQIQQAASQESLNSLHQKVESLTGRFDAVDRFMERADERIKRVEPRS